MATAIELKMPAKTRTKEATKLAVDDLAAKYVEVTEELKALETRREELQEIIRDVMGSDSKLETSLGDFVRQERRSYSWSLETIKDIMGRNWTSFVKADDKVLRAKMETKDEIGCSLEAAATVKTVEALLFKATA